MGLEVNFWSCLELTNLQDISSSTSLSDQVILATICHLSTTHNLPFTVFFNAERQQEICKSQFLVFGLHEQNLNQS